MDLLIEKDDKHTYLSRYKVITTLSRYKVITTSFEESSPSVKRNNTQIQYRNGNVDFGGWNESKTIDYVGYYRADDLEDEEYLRERIYALLSDPEGYYITQLKNDSDNSFERPGETSGDYFDKQVNRPSHKRFYVYASSLESELVGSYGGHVLYKISATFTTMKLPYGESVPRDLDVKPNVPYIGDNILTNTSTDYLINANDNNYNFYRVYTELIPGNVYSFASEILQSGIGKSGKVTISMFNRSITNKLFENYILADSSRQKVTFKVPNNLKDNAILILYSDIVGQTAGISASFHHMKLEIGSPTNWSPSPSDLGYSEWYIDTYYNTDNLIIPYAGTVPCNQLEQGFAIEFTAKEAGSMLVIDVNGTELTYNGQVYSGDVIKLSGYEYTKNDISIVKYTNKAYFKLIPGIANRISSNLHGSIRILGYQDLYA